MRSLRSSTVSGVKWTTLSIGIANIIQVIQMAVLAHLLSKSDFGLMSMTMVVIGFAQAFSDMGISNAIIYRQDSTKNQLSSLYWMNVFAGVIVCILVLATTPLIVWFYKEPKLADLIFWVALIFPITAIGQQFQMLLQKELMFSKLTKIEVTSSVVGSVVAILSALKGQGVFSLVWGQISNVSVRNFLLVFSSWRNWRPSLRFKWEDLKGYLNFGLFQMGERSLNYLSANIDYLIIGKCLGTEILGVYTLAYQLVVMPLTKINPIITRVSFPVFSKIQTDNFSLRNGYLEMIKIIAFVIFPLLVGLAATAPLFVPILYGAKWESAICIVQILSILGIVKSLGNPNGSIYLAKGLVRFSFYWNVIILVVNFLTFWYVIKYGIYVFAWTEVALSVLFFLTGPVCLKIIIGLDFKKYFFTLSRPACFSITMGIVVTCVLYLAKNTIETIPLFIVLVFSGIIIYLFLMVCFEREYTFKMVKLFTKRQES